EGETVVDAPAVRHDPFVGPVASEPKSAPGTDVGRAAPVLATEHRIELRQRELPDRITHMHEEHLGVVEVPDVKASSRDLDAERRIVHHAFERCGGGRVYLLAEYRDVPTSGVQRPDCRSRTVHPVVDLQARKMSSKTCLPRLDEHPHEVTFEAPVPPEADGRGHNLLGLIRREGREGRSFDVLGTNGQYAHHESD